MNGIESIDAERQRQITDLDVTDAGDDTMTQGELAGAAAAYALATVDTGDDELNRQLDIAAAIAWPWPDFPMKPKDRRRNLVKAGALIVAEIDRLDRLDNPLS